jgi:hypothetical protein
VDIRVKADTPVVAMAHKKSFSAKGLQVVLGPGSLLEQHDKNEFQLVKGEFLVELQSIAKLKTPFATVTCDGDPCLALIHRDSTQVQIKALRGEFRVRRLGEKTDYGLGAGLQLTVMEVADNGVAEMEFPQSLPWDSTVKEWAHYYSGTSKEFRETLIQFREDWQQAVERVSQIHEQYAGRVIASYEATLAEERSRKAAQEREDAKMRKLFREKNNVSP